MNPQMNRPRGQGEADRSKPNFNAQSLATASKTGNTGAGAPIELLLSRLDNPRSNGRDRWRCACPVCGEKNKSTLSVGVGDTGCILLKCFKSECGPDDIAAAVGLTVEDLFPPRESSARPMARRRLITAGQALEVLEDEITLALVCCSDMARGKALDRGTHERLMVAAARIAQIQAEVRA